MNFEKVTIDHCIRKFEEDHMCVIIQGGKITGFEPGYGEDGHEQRSKENHG